jgi:hypothetical protein
LPCLFCTGMLRAREAVPHGGASHTKKGLWVRIISKRSSWSAWRVRSKNQSMKFVGLNVVNS